LKWTDGKPFTSADVVYTVDLAQHNTAINKFGLPLAGATADGTYGVTINFTQPAYSDAYYALGRVEMLPKHIWQSQSAKAITTSLNTHPVGTGAYEVSSVSGTRCRSSRRGSARGTSWCPQTVRSAIARTPVPAESPGRWLRSSGDGLLGLDDWGLETTRRLLVPSPTHPVV